VTRAVPPPPTPQPRGRDDPLIDCPRRASTSAATKLVPPAEPEATKRDRAAGRPPPPRRVPTVAWRAGGGQRGRAARHRRRSCTLRRDCRSRNSQQRRGRERRCQPTRPRRSPDVYWKNCWGALSPLPKIPVPPVGSCRLPARPRSCACGGFARRWHYRCFSASPASGMAATGRQQFPPSRRPPSTVMTQSRQPKF